MAKILCSKANRRPTVYGVLLIFLLAAIFAFPETITNFLNSINLDYIFTVQ